MRTLLLTTSILAIAGVAHAEAANTVQTTELSEVTVIGTRTERRVDEVPATVSVITAEDIEAMLATDIKDLIRFEPGISVPTSPTRFNAALSGAGRDGNSGFTIRGLGGDRVLMVTDGIRTPDGFAFGAQNVGRGGYNDLDMIRSVEILRGPASALYGSDGVAGAVSFTTKDPEDFLIGGQNFGARARVAYGSADESLSEGVAIAGRSGALSGLLAYTRRDASETETQGDVGGTGSARTQANPLDFASNALLGKLVWEMAPGHRLRLTVDHYDSLVEGEALSSINPAMPPFSPNAVLQVLGSDDTERDRVSLDWRFTNFLGLDRGSVAAYWQESTTRQFTFEDRDPAVDRTRDVMFDNRVVGLAAQGERTFDLNGVDHRLMFGADYSETRQVGLRDGTIPPAGEVFPARPFPITEYTLAGLFVQDEISLLDGRLNVIPALRFDWYELNAIADPLYFGALADQNDEHISPKIGVVYWANDQFGLYASYGAGFKAPTPMQVNSAFSNPLIGYVSIPNPDLGPETSQSFEAGFRLRDVAAVGGVLSLSGAVFHTQYDDFISQEQVGGAFTPLDPAIYQYVNLHAVEIWGLEARGALQWDNGFRLDVAASYADGEQDTGAVASLPTIDPIKVVAGLGYRDPAGVFGGQAIVTSSDATDPADTDGLGCYNAATPALGCYVGDAFTLVDLTAYWNVTERATLRAGVFNLFDETYGWWSDIRGLSAASATLDAYTQPGRNFNVSLALRF
jgi:hemoglobin/transferrin/lactoferrin receptor protein